MNKRQKIVQKQFINNEEAVIKRLKQVYSQSLKDIEKKAQALQDDINRLGTLAKLSTDAEEKAKFLSMQQSKVYQKQYQDALKKQIGAVLDNMQVEEFKTVAEYLNKCYEEGFVGAMYDLQGQGIPLCFPMDQEAIVRAVQLDSKISNGLYSRLGEDVALLKKKITAQVSRGIATGMTFNQVAQQLAGYTNIGFNNAARIVRTEGHRIQIQSAMDACHKAKERGADIVKQWDATLDMKTRESHQNVDGEVRELDEKFSNGLMFPGDPSGGAAEVVNCRCALLQRARWAVKGGFTKWDGESGELVDFSSLEEYNTFKEKYWAKAKEVEQAQDSKMFPEQLAGVKRGQPMSFEEANEMKANPDFGKVTGSTINCQSCVVSYEARRRGYDVETLPNYQNPTAKMLSQATNKAWIDPATGKPPEYIFDADADTATKFGQFLGKAVEQGGRYTLQFAWKGRGNSGHIIHADRLEDGTLRLYDPQCGKAYTGKAIQAYLKRIKYSATVYGTKVPVPAKILRVDDKQFNISVVEKIMKGAK